MKSVCHISFGAALLALLFLAGCTAGEVIGNTPARQSNGSGSDTGGTTGGGTTGGGTTGGGSPPPTGTESVTLEWDGVSLNADNATPLTDLAGYRVYLAQSPGAYTPGNYTRQLGANSTGGTITTTIGNLAAGTYYIVVAAFDTSYNESNFSNEIRVTLP